jgi:putative thioredoxin
MTAHTRDVSVADFEANVLEESRRRPVVVDFWAPWCGPCRSLKPIMEKLAEEYAGEFLLARINSDDNQQLAAQFGVRGIPAVMAVVNGEIVDEFTGALPESAVRAWLEKLLPGPVDLLRRRAAEQLAADDGAGALQTLTEAATLDPQDEWVRLDTARVLAHTGDTAAAQRLLDGMRGEAASSAEAMRLKARLAILAGAPGGRDEAELKSRLAADAGDLDARLQLAKLSAAAGDYSQAFDQLLEIIRRNRRFEDDIARRTMLDLFTLLGADPLVGEYRRKLASALS